MVKFNFFLTAFFVLTTVQAAPSSPRYLKLVEATEQDQKWQKVASDYREFENLVTQMYRPGVELSRPHQIWEGLCLAEAKASPTAQAQYFEFNETTFLSLHGDKMLIWHIPDYYSSRMLRRSLTPSNLQEHYAPLILKDAERLMGNEFIGHSARGFTAHTEDSRLVGQSIGLFQDGSTEVSDSQILIFESTLDNKLITIQQGRYKVYSQNLTIENLRIICTWQRHVFSLPQIVAKPLFSLVR